MQRTHAVVGIDDVRQAVGANRHLEVVEQRAVGAAGEAADADIPVVVLLVTHLAHREHGLAAVRIKRLREHHKPVRAIRHCVRAPSQLTGTRRIRDERWGGVARLVPDDIDLARVPGGDPREDRRPGPRTHFERAIEVLPAVVRGGKPDVPRGRGRHHGANGRVGAGAERGPDGVDVPGRIGVGRRENSRQVAAVGRRPGRCGCRRVDHALEDGMVRDITRRSPGRKGWRAHDIPHVWLFAERRIGSVRGDRRRQKDPEDIVCCLADEDRTGVRVRYGRCELGICISRRRSPWRVIHRRRETDHLGREFVIQLVEDLIDA